MNRSTYTTLSKYSRPALGSPRISKNDLLSLRAAELKEDSGRKIFENVLAEFRNLLSSFTFMEPEKSTPMCKNYGHVIRGAWYGNRVKCDDCGATINDPEQLRKATTQN